MEKTDIIGKLPSFDFGTGETISTILIVYDDIDLQKLIKTQFNKQINAGSFYFIFVHNAIDALEKLKKNPNIDVVISDINIAKIDGQTFLDEIIERYPLIKTVIVSDHNDISNIKSAMNKGVFDFITKPFNKSDLTTTTYKALKEVHRFKAMIRSQIILEKANKNAETARHTSEKLVDERTRELTNLNEKMDLLSGVFNNTIEGITITDHGGKIETVNPSFTKITGYAPEEVIGRTPRLLKSNRHDKEFYKHMWDTLIETGQWSGEIWNRRKNGETYPEWLSITTIKEAEATKYLAIFHDITDVKQSEERFAYQTNHDPLTSLPNRQLFYDRLIRAIAHAHNSNQMIAVMILDLDNFKNVNDSLGHYAGDLILQEVAIRLRSCCKGEETISRPGGDEFMLILPDIKKTHNAVKMVHRIIDSFEKPVSLLENEYYIKASIGITIYPLDGKNEESLIKNADMALYKAKDQGKNRYSMFAQSMDEKARQRISMESNLRKGLTRNEFKVHYQPKVDVKTGLITGTEALVRWQRSEKELIPPDQFIPIAEESGLILPLGKWVLLAACRQTLEWHKAGYNNLSVAVNFSVKQFQEENLIASVKTILKESGLSPEFLNMEITENLMMTKINESIIIMKKLVDMGIKISIDDFGTGHSSLGYLKKFPVDVLKIDKSFIKEIPGNADDVAIAKAILSMAASLNMKVVAEGVETQEQLEILKANGLDEMQGYLFSRPLPAEELALLLKKNGKKTNKNP